MAGITQGEMEHFLVALQQAVSSDSPEAVARCMNYPVRLMDDHGTHIVRDEREMVSRYRKVFTVAMRREIARQSVGDLFANDRGVMIGRGAVWIAARCAPDVASQGCRDPQLGIITLNLEAL